MTDSVKPMVEALTRVMEMQDFTLLQHARRVQGHAIALAEATSTLDPLMLDAIGAASLLHDIGKLGIPGHLLEKPGPLTAHEYDLIKEHVTIGADILALVPFPGPVALIVRHHHENWDGSGYPNNLKGDAIPIGARVLAVVDGYDALTSDRPYRRARSPEVAAAMIYQRRGIFYDPTIADAFLRMLDRPLATATRLAGARRHVRRLGPRRLEGWVG